MPTPPYRTAAARPSEPPPAPVDEATRLGVLRSTHTPRAGWHRLVLGLLVASFLVAIGIPLAKNACSPEQTIFPFVVFFGAAAVMTLAGAQPIRLRGFRIELHANGVALIRGRSRTVVVFDDVDEVWFDFSYYSAHATIDRVTLVERGGVAHRVPMQVNDASMLWNWIVKSCSTPLLPDARKALDGGEALTFGRFKFDRESITFGRKRIAWSELRLVRFLPGRIAFFRRMPVFPWRTINLGAVPHPSIFVKLVKDCARPSVKIEDDARWMSD